MNEGEDYPFTSEHSSQAEPFRQEIYELFTNYNSGHSFGTDRQQSEREDDFDLETNTEALFASCVSS